MRLIDADELKKALAEMWYENNIRITGLSVAELIDDAPTIEPSKSAEQNVADVPSGDLISRKEVHKVLSLLATEGGKDAKLLFSDAHESIDALPSAEPKWIPCSERLPLITTGGVLATTRWGEITIADRFSTDKWFIHEGNSNAKTSDILAWMPLPKPYGESEVEE